MWGQGLFKEIGVEVSISLFFERVGEAESFIELSLQDGIGAETGLDNEQLGKGYGIPVKERDEVVCFFLVLLRGVRITRGENAE